MTPEDNFNQQVWEILQNLKEESLVTEEGKPVKHLIPSLQGVGIIPKERRINILFKLQEWGAVRVIDNPFEPPIAAENEVYVYILEPKFDEIYQRFQSLVHNKLVVVTTDNSQEEPTDVLMSDLEAKYKEIESENDTQKFFLRIADYGKYLLDHKSFEQFLAPFINEKNEEVKNYVKACDTFWEKWETLAKDLIEKAEAAGIKDDPVSPFVSQIHDLKGKLNEKPDYDEEYIGWYYRPYQELVERFQKDGKTELIADKHLTEKNGNVYPHLEDDYLRADEEWKKFERKRDLTVWLAHYQIMRATYGILELEDNGQYFQNDNQIDQIYRGDFHSIARGGKGVLLNKKRFEAWIKRLHAFLIPRLRVLPTVLKARDEIAKAIPGVLGQYTETMQDIIKRIQSPMVQQAFKVAQETSQKLRDVQQYQATMSQPITVISRHEIEKNAEEAEIRRLTLEKLRKEVKEEPGTQPSASTTLTKREIKKIIKDIIKVREFGKKEAKLLTILGNLEPHDLKKLESEIPTKACTKLKEKVLKQLAGTGLSIKTHNGKGYKASFYQLVLLSQPTSK